MATALMSPWLDPVDEIGSTAGLDDVAAQRDGSGTSLAFWRRTDAADAAEIVGGELLGQAVEPVSTVALGRNGPAQVVVEDLGGPGSEVVRFQARQVDRA